MTRMYFQKKNIRLVIAMTNTISLMMTKSDLPSLIFAKKSYNV